MSEFDKGERDERIAECAQRYTASFVKGMEVGQSSAKRSLDLFEVSEMPDSALDEGRVIVDACIASMNHVFVRNPDAEFGQLEAARYGAEIAAEEMLAERPRRITSN